MVPVRSLLTDRSDEPFMSGDRIGAGSYRGRRLFDMCISVGDLCIFRCVVPVK